MHCGDRTMHHHATEKLFDPLSAFLTTPQTTAITGKIRGSINSIAIAAD